MKVYITGSSALHYWRRVQDASALEDAPLAKLPSDCPTTSADLVRLELESRGFGKAPIHLMVPETRFRISRSLYSYSVFAKELPEGAFRKLDEHVYIASPEFCVVQAALVYSQTKLVELCMELCGTYSLVPESEHGFITRSHQLMSVESLQSFVRQMHKVKGAGIVASILSYLQNGSRSPMETREYLLLCMPKKHGGFGLPKARLNFEIDLDEEEQGAANRRCFVSDMCWPGQKVIVEYDGDVDHSSRDARSKDAIKKNILTSKGFTVFTVTGNEIMDVAKTTHIAKTIARKLGHRLQKFPDNWSERHRKLRKELFDSMYK